MLGVLLTLPACTVDKGGESTGGTAEATTGGTTTADTTGDDTPVASTVEDTTGDVVTSTSQGATGDDPEGVTSSSSSEAGETTEGQPGTVLDACMVDEPCPWTYIDSCQDFDCDDPAMKCMWPLLRDGVQFRIRWAPPNQDESWHGWIALGDAERTVLTTWREGPQDAPVERCKLVEPAFFTACIDNPDDESCQLPGNWISDCVEEVAPACPAP